MTPWWRRVSFVAGALVLCGLSRVANDPAWDVGLSLLMASATYLTASIVVQDLLVRRRVTLRSIIFRFGSTSATFHVYQWWRTGSPQLDWWAGNLAGSRLLYFCAGVLWNLDLRGTRLWLPASAAAIIGFVSLAMWSWP